MFASTLNLTGNILAFTILQRTVFILSIVGLFWIFFLIIYLISRVVIRLISNFKRWHSPPSNPKVCQAFVISSNEYGSFRPLHTLYRSDSLFSSINTPFPTEKISKYSVCKTSLLEHYLQTYNPLQIDRTDSHIEPITRSNVKVLSDTELRSDTEARTIDNCYPLLCTNKQSFHQTGRYVRLKEQENCSVTLSLDDRLSECSTKLTSTTLPMIMVTDCSNIKRLHTDIIEMNEEEY